jgi:signal transduction histidine kinase
VGIPPADQEWLFNPFHRGGNVGNRPGTGLGLVIVKRCVDLLGGEIKITSTLGSGTQATVKLPMFDSNVAEEPSSGKSSGTSSNAGPMQTRLSGQTSLIP